MPEELESLDPNDLGVKDKRLELKIDKLIELLELSIMMSLEKEGIV